MHDLEYISNYKWIVPLFCFVIFPVIMICITLIFSKFSKNKNEKYLERRWLVLLYSLG